MSPFAQYEDFKDCVNKNKDKKNPEAYCSSIQKKVTGKWPSKEESYTNPVIVNQPANHKLSLSIYLHIENPLTEQERKSILYDIMKATDQQSLDKLWYDIGLEAVTGDISGIELESRIDLHAYLTEVCPQLPSLTLKDIAIRCNCHTDIVLQHPEEGFIKWSTTNDMVAVQYLESGDTLIPFRNKLSNNKMGDIIVSEGWMHTKEPDSESLILLTQGSMAYGISSNDMCEYYFWAEQPFESISGKWYMKYNIESEEWMITKPRVVQHPFILDEAQPEEPIVYSPELLNILLNDPLGKLWLEGFGEDIVHSTYNKYNTTNSSYIYNSVTVNNDNIYTFYLKDGITYTFCKQ